MGGLTLSAMGFIQPMILLALISLPVLWLILRMTPPPPKTVRLPTYRFLEDLIPPEQTAQKTPLWLLLLRLLAAALIIIGFAGPILNIQKLIPANAEPRLVIDNSWAAAAQWDEIQGKALSLADEASRHGKGMRLVLTAADPQNADLQEKTLTASEAKARIRALEPRPWASDLNAVSVDIANDAQNYHSFFLSSGLATPHFDTLSALLVQKGGLSVALPKEDQLPYLLRRDMIGSIDNGFAVTLEALSAEQTLHPLTIQAIDAQNTVIHSLDVTPEDWTKTVPDTRASVAFTLPSALARKVQRLQLRQQKTAGSTLIVDPSLAKKFVGIVEVDGDKANKAYIGASFYLRRALEPFADLTFGSMEEVLRQNPSVIVLPDEVALFPMQLNALQEWINDGGILLRFAGARLSESRAPLVPVLLRGGGRSLEGEISWDSAKALAPFAQDSLFYGLESATDVKIRQMVLADPSQDLKDKSWATLEDGTPIVTYKAQENGLIVLIHTTATPDWSNLPLSGLYVDILKRIIDLSGQGAKPAAQINVQQAFAMLDPVYTLNAFGQASAPSALVKPIKLSDAVSGVPLSPILQAGMYARGGLSKTINVSDSVTTFELVKSADLPFSANRIDYAGAGEERPGSTLLYLALLLLAIDLASWFVLMGAGRVHGHSMNHRMAHNESQNNTMKGRGVLPLIARLRASKATQSHMKTMLWAAGIALFAAFGSVTVPSALAPAHAADQPQQAEFANDLHLAYIKTGDSAVDEISQMGLEELAITLTQRTSAEPYGVTGLDLYQDDLSFFPFIYWPVTPSQRALQPIILKKVQNYIDQGGMILFDVKGGRGFTGNQSSADLQRLIGPLTLPPLEIAPKDHVLRRSFYLLDEFPGVYPDYPLWVEQREDGRMADASSVLIGSNDWAGAWAKGSSTRQNEMAMRFGINAVMYALTGNYKTDQIHVKHILERLGE